MVRCACHHDVTATGRRVVVLAGPSSQPLFAFAFPERHGQ
jgi:hypothetical protein